MTLKPFKYSKQAYVPTKRHFSEKKVLCEIETSTSFHFVNVREYLALNAGNCVFQHPILCEQHSKTCPHTVYAGTLTNQRVCRNKFTTQFPTN